MKFAITTTPVYCKLSNLKKTWEKVQPYVDPERFVDVKEKLGMQQNNAQLWNDGCVLYFQRFSKIPISGGIEQPVGKLEEIMNNDMKRPMP